MRWIGLGTLGLAAVLFGQTASWVHGNDAPEQQLSEVTVVTIFDEQIVAPLHAVDQDQFVLATKPLRTFPFDEVKRVEMGSEPGLTLKWIGQDGHDFVSVGTAEGGNDVQDMHLRLIHLPTQRQISQILAVCRYPKLVRAWRLDSSKSTHWRLQLERSNNEWSDTADLYLEPSSFDAFDQTFSLTITFDDGSKVKISTKADSHTSDQLKVGKIQTSTSEADGVLPTAVVHLQGGDILHGQLRQISDEILSMRTTWDSEVDLPLLYVLGVRFSATTNPDAKARFEKLIVQPGSQDTVIVIDRKNTLATVAGHVHKITNEKLHLTYGDQPRAINRNRLIGVVFASHPPVETGELKNQTFRLLSGDRITGNWTGMTNDALEMTTFWDEQLKLPRHSIWEIMFRGGRMVYLSDLEAISVEEVPYFGRLMSYRRDQNLKGGPLRMNDEKYRKGLAVHSRCVLSYALDGQFDQFKALVGFDDSVRERGRVKCRVLADGKELFSKADLRGSDEPTPVDVSVVGIQQLTLEVDFGENEDTGDRVIWAEARLFRSKALSTGD